MSQEGRDGLSLVFGSMTYLKWAASPFHLVDARKLASEFAGTRRPTCGDPFAKGLQKLCRENPPTPSNQQPVSPLAEPWRGDGLFVNAVSSFDGSRRTPAWQAGFRTCYVQLLHAPNYTSNVQHLDILRDERFQVGGWGTYGQDTDPAQDARDAAALVKSLGLVCWKANGEAWAEKEYAWKTSAFLNAWNAAGAPCPLGWSVLSSDTANFGRSFDYVSALAAAGADVDVQVYGAVHPGLTVGAALGMLDKTPVPVNRTTMTFNVTPDGGGPFADYRTWPGPRRVWVAEWTTADTYRQLAR